MSAVQDVTRFEPGSQDEQREQRRRIRRTTLLLALVALGIYVAFIVSSMLGVRS